nr:CFF_HP1_G0040710.mRNA.1.CDS.1 [Saccharomyces cerevisiae]
MLEMVQPNQYLGLPAPTFKRFNQFGAGAPGMTTGEHRILSTIGIVSGINRTYIALLMRNNRRLLAEGGMTWGKAIGHGRCHGKGAGSPI